MAQWGPRNIEAYANFLSDLDYSDAHPAIDKLAKTNRFPPSIAEIRETVAEDVLGLPSSFAAWEQFSVKDPARHELVRRVERTLGGYHAYAASDAPGVFRSQFLKLYESARAEAMVTAVAGRPALPPAQPPAQIAEKSHMEEVKRDPKLLALMQSTLKTIRSG